MLIIKVTETHILNSSFSSDNYLDLIERYQVAFS
jgi:hypothetical protein